MYKIFRLNVTRFKVRLDSIARTSYGNVAGWLAGCFFIKTTKSILKLFRPSGSPIIEAFGTPCADTKFQGEPLHRGHLIHVVRKIGDFQRILTFISETVRDRPMVTMEVMGAALNGIIFDDLE